MICRNNALISIIGKGIGGLTLANALDHSGYKNIKIYDQLKNVEKSAKGMGIIVACNADNEYIRFKCRVERKELYYRTNEYYK